MTEIAGTGHHTAATATVHESYSFACMRCGHGWEQSYEIEHHRDAEGHEYVVYVANGQAVPSPLSRPTCQNCGGHVVRIMRAGQVSSVQNLMRHPRPAPRAHAADDASDSGPGDGSDGDGTAPPVRKPHHHWHFSDLLHPFGHHGRKVVAPGPGADGSQPSADKIA
ncbi:hypothetical protein ACIQNU_31450 [Streptomyces sp. NPDC091292]|uniref:hypothetical protein n=1 Tax=Streptomyces sp. NPDC091292 TaxID=3365991 RepID=UPI0037F19D5D